MAGRGLGKRRTPSLRQVADLLNRPATGRIWQRHQQHRELRNYLRARLPSFLSEHCCACIVRDDHLIVFTSSAAGATPLRFALAPLLPELQARFALPLRRAQVRVLNDHRAAETPRVIRPPGHTAIDDLQQAAAHCAVPELRSALLRLAATCKRLARSQSES
jgi:hypothetical protein